LFAGWTFGLWILFTKFWSTVKYEYEPVLWGMYKKARIASINTSDDVASFKAWAGCLMILFSTIIALIIIF
jgi:hypothetical protein